jgi:cytochrome P450
VIGELLGVPAADRPQFRELVTEWSMVLEILNPPTVDRADAAAQRIIDYFQGLIDERRAHPADDLMSAVVRAATEQPELNVTDDELIRLAALILAAGFETTTGLLANGLVALLEHPAQAAQLRARAELAGPATEELLRYDSPVQMIYGRSAVADINVGETRLHAGQRVITLLGGANRDPSVFNRPHELILDRDEGGPLSFGAGIHHCLGAALARLEGQVMFPRLLERFPGLGLDGKPEHRPGLAIHSYAKLPVTFA